MVIFKIMHKSSKVPTKQQVKNLDLKNSDFLKIQILPNNPPLFTKYGSK